MELEKERKDNARFFLIDFCGYQSKPPFASQKAVLSYLHTGGFVP